MIPIDEQVHFDIILRDPDTRIVSDADSTPTFSVFEEATDTPILADVNLTKRTSLTGHYRGTFTASAANGLEVGKWYSVVVSATVSGYSDKDVALLFRCAPAEDVAGYPKVDTQYVEGAAPDDATSVADAVDLLLTDAVPDSVPSDGSRPSIKQALYLLTQFMLERSVSGTTLTVKKPDGSTTLVTLTLDDATTPQSITRAT